MEKNLSFFQRLNFAITGLLDTWRTEKSFRTQGAAALGAVGILIYLKPGAIWTALVLLTSASVLAAELINTALERLLDHLHPGQHSAIKQAKDCAAAAVLVLSLSSLGVFIALLIEVIPKK